MTFLVGLCKTLIQQVNRKNSFVATGRVFWAKKWPTNASAAVAPPQTLFLEFTALPQTP